MFFLFMALSESLERGDSELLDDYIRRTAAGDEDGLTNLYEKTRVSVYGIALSITKNAEDAEDVTQDTYIRIWQSAHQYKSKGFPLAWILKIARNEALQTLRKRKDVATDPADLSALAEKPAVTAEDRMVLESLFSELEQDEREIVTLYAVTGMKHREIADMLNLPLSTELSKYQRTLKKLGKRWEREMEA
ncbi:MAG: RNA polymerase sigma factor [Lachnospiraceae bacterium]|nr:RNA polymerase sigma factor [Lachnospiraceae bacterium]